MFDAAIEVVFGDFGMELGDNLLFCDFEFERLGSPGEILPGILLRRNAGGKSFQVMFLKDTLDQLRELIRRAAKAGDADLGRFFSDLFIEGWDAAIRQGQEADGANTGLDHFFHPAD